MSQERGSVVVKARVQPVPGNPARLEFACVRERGSQGGSAAWQEIRRVLVVKGPISNPEPDSC